MLTLKRSEFLFGLQPKNFFSVCNLIQLQIYVILGSFHIQIVKKTTKLFVFCRFANKLNDMKTQKHQVGTKNGSLLHIKKPSP